MKQLTLNTWSRAELLCIEIIREIANDVVEDNRAKAVDENDVQPAGDPTGPLDDIEKIVVEESALNNAYEVIMNNHKTNRNIIDALNNKATKHRKKELASMGKMMDIEVEPATRGTKRQLFITAFTTTTPEAVIVNDDKKPPNDDIIEALKHNAYIYMQKVE